jgi:molybdopterin molybdotransferase
MNYATLDLPSHHRTGTDTAMTARTVPLSSITIDEALERIRTRTPVHGLEHVGIAATLGRVLAEEVTARRPVPAHDSSAMDGYAFRVADLTAARRMPLQGRVAAGHPLGEPLRPGFAVRIFTGGVMPVGADTVALQEDCAAGEGFVDLPADLRAGANRRPAGEDMAEGTLVLMPGARLRPQDIGVATAVGRTTLVVRRQVKVGVIATGDELRPPGEPLPPGCVHDTNRHTVTALLRRLGALVTDYGIVPDHPQAIRDSIATAAVENDLIISTGGVSVGDEDHVRGAVEDLGSLEFWRLPLKPGRPVAVGEVSGVPFLGLPGNPAAAMTAFWLIGRPLVLRLMGADELGFPRFPVMAGFRHKRAPSRREFLRCRLRSAPDGTVRAEVYPKAGSGMVQSLAWADGLVEVLETDGDVEVGDIVRYVPYSALDA